MNWTKHTNVLVTDRPLLLKFSYGKTDNGQWVAVQKLKSLYGPHGTELHADDAEVIWQSQSYFKTSEDCLDFISKYSSDDQIEYLITKLKDKKLITEHKHTPDGQLMINGPQWTGVSVKIALDNDPK